MAKKPEVPLLKAYLGSVASYPDYMPQWTNYVGWVVAAVVGCIVLSAHGTGLVGLGIILALAVASQAIVRSRYQPRTPSERVAEASFAAVRRLQGLHDDLEKSLPEPVILALERAVAAHAAAFARWQLEDAVAAHEAKASLDECLFACFRAVVPVIRRHDSPKTEWQAVCTNQEIVGPIVDTIEAHRSRLQGTISGGSERRAALQELYDEMPIDLMQGS